MSGDERGNDEAAAPEVQATDGELAGASRGERPVNDDQRADAANRADAETDVSARQFDMAIVTVDALSATSTLRANAGMPFDDPEHGPGRVAFLVATGPADDDAPSAVLAVELADWSASAPLTSGQFHRLVNGLAGRGRRNTVRPLAADERHVHLAGTPEQLTVEYDGRTVHVPAGPRRGLSKALRAFETGDGPGTAS